MPDFTKLISTFVFATFSKWNIHCLGQRHGSICNLRLWLYVSLSCKSWLHGESRVAAVLSDLKVDTHFGYNVQLKFQSRRMPGIFRMLHSQSQVLRQKHKILLNFKRFTRFKMFILIWFVCLDTWEEKDIAPIWCAGKKTISRIEVPSYLYIVVQLERCLWEWIHNWVELMQRRNLY